MRMILRMVGLAGIVVGLMNYNSDRPLCLVMLLAGLILVISASSRHAR